MSKSVLTQFHQCLKKCFQILERNHNQWCSVNAECKPLLDSLSNIGEQLMALSKVKLAITPLQGFPDLHGRLRYKLLQAADIVLGKLAEKMCALQAVRDAVANQVAAAFQLYEQNTDTLDLDTCVERSAVAPSIADMLEWMQDAERYYRKQLLRRKGLLQMLTPDDLTLLESAPKRWGSLDSPSGEEIIPDTLLRVSLFVDSL